MVVNRRMYIILATWWGQAHDFASDILGREKTPTRDRNKTVTSKQSARIYILFIF